MHITAGDMILLAHSTFGVLGILAAVWVFVDTLNASAQGARRVRAAAFVTALCMNAAWLVGGYWYVHLYPADRAFVLHGPWPWAHTLVMETKEHLFFVILILSWYLPIATADDLVSSPASRRMVLASALLVVLTGLAVEGAGAIVNHGVKLALLAGAGGVR